MLFSVYYLRKISLTFAVIQSPETIEEEELSKNVMENSEGFSKPTSYELQRLAREKKFDERITSLKDELSAYQGNTAEILHPSIVNLPHDSIRTKYDLPSYEEVAE